MIDVGTYLRRALRTWAMYTGRRELVRPSIAALREQIAVASEGDRVLFRFTPGAIVTGQMSEDEGDEAADSVVYVAFRDGLRALSIDPTIPEEELTTLVGILASGTDSGARQSEDVVAQLWAANLPSVLVSAVDPYAEVGFEGEADDEDAFARDLMPHNFGASTDEELDLEALALASSRRSAPKADGGPTGGGDGARIVDGNGTPGVRLSGPRTLAEAVEGEVARWTAPPAVEARWHLEAMKAAIVQAPPLRDEWISLASAQGGSKLALSIDRLIDCLKPTSGAIDALMLASVAAWQSDNGRALDLLTRRMPELPDGVLERWRSTLTLNGSYAVAVRGALRVQAPRVPAAVDRWFELAGETHIESVSLGLFNDRDHSVVASWMKHAPGAGTLVLRPWLAGTGDEANWAVGCALDMPIGEARSATLRRALGHRDPEVQYRALFGLAGDVAKETDAALGRALASGRRDVAQFALRELAARSDLGAGATLLAHVETNEFALTPAIGRAAILDALLAHPHADVILWVREKTSGWSWRLAVRGRERQADIAAALQRLPATTRQAYA